MNYGDEIKGILHSADASSGAEITLFDIGSYAARTLGADEYIVIESLELVTVAGGDCRVFTGADATPGTGEDAARGTFAANGGIVFSHLLHFGKAGHKAYVVAPAGVVDVILYGAIRKERQTDRPSWREALLGR